MWLLRYVLFYEKYKKISNKIIDIKNIISRKEFKCFLILDKTCKFAFSVKIYIHTFE